MIQTACSGHCEESTVTHISRISRFSTVLGLVRFEAIARSIVSSLHSYWLPTRLRIRIGCSDTNVVTALSLYWAQPIESNRETGAQHLN